MDNRARSPEPASSDISCAFAMTIRRLPLLACLAACSPIVALHAFPPPAEDPPQQVENGTLGFQPPEVGDVRLADTRLHEDTTGGVIQELLGVSGSQGGGFGLVWRDQRDGSLGIYCTRLDDAGDVREPERSVTASKGTGRRFDPAIAIGPDGSGIVAWVGKHPSGHRPWLRGFSADGSWYGTDMLVPVAAGSEPAQVRGVNARDAGNSVARSPVLVVRHNGARTLVWTESGRLRTADFDVAGTALRPAADLGPAGTEPEVGLFAVEDTDGGLNVLWNGKGGAWFTRRSEPGAKSTDLQLGTGRVRGLVADPSGGTWGLLQREDAAVLRRVNAEGKLQPDEVVQPYTGLRELALAWSPAGLALLATRGEAAPTGKGPGRGRGGRDQMLGPQRPTARGTAPRAAAPTTGSTSRLELILCDAAGSPRGEGPIVVTSADARDIDSAFLASDGEHLLVAWDDARLGDADVWARIVTVTPEGRTELGPEKRLNTDYASSDQIKPDADALGERGWTVWQDRRAGGGSIYARAFGAQGLIEHEILLPRPFGGTAAENLPGGSSEPGVTLRAGGNALVTWTQTDGERNRILGQILAPDGSAASPVLEIEGRPSGTIQRAAVTALGGDRGWLVAWPGGGKLGILARRLGPDGVLAGPARRISEPSDDDTSQPDVTLLDDGRCIAAWTVHANGGTAEKGWTVRARFLDVDGAPKGSEMRFEASRRSQDHGPVLAPAQNGGFLMAWCSGYPGEGLKDVNLRLFDGQGKAAGPNLTPCYLANEQDMPDVTRLADGSFAVAWEDDISYNDMCYVRRVAANGKTLGPWMRITELDTLFVPDRVAPRITALGDGWAAVFADRRRSRGFDAWIKIVGPLFDPAETK